MKFVWHDDYEGRRLFENALQKTLINIKKISKNNIDELAKAIERQNSYQLEKLQNVLKAINQTEKEKLKKRVKFLNEQYSIAIELGIETNRLDSSALFKSNEVLYYLRGSKAIKKEIELIESRNDEDVLLMSDGYVEVNKEIALLKYDKSSIQLINAAKLIESANSRDWVEFDTKLAEVKSQKKSMLYIALSTVLGGIVGVIHVLISNAIRKRKGQLEKA